MENIYLCYIVCVTCGHICSPVPNAMEEEPIRICEHFSALSRIENEQAEFKTNYYYCKAQVQKGDCHLSMCINSRQRSLRSSSKCSCGDSVVGKCSSMHEVLKVGLGCAIQDIKFWVIDKKYHRSSWIFLFLQIKYYPLLFSQNLLLNIKSLEYLEFSTGQSRNLLDWSDWTI